jgi:hypothetical protein
LYYEERVRNHLPEYAAGLVDAQNLTGKTQQTIVQMTCGKTLKNPKILIKKNY